MISTVRYTAENKEAWDAFVRESKNATFLHQRDYMEYHADRFPDHSLLFFSDDELVALLPATAKDDVLHSHAGLTYGGLLMSTHNTTIQVCHIFQALMDYMRHAHFRRLVYRPAPHIYHSVPAEEDLYALHQVCNASLAVRKVSEVLDLQHPLPIRKRRQRYIRSAIRQGVQVVSSTDFSAYWPILSDTLGNKYDARPVHSLAEIELLHSRFPENIQLLLTQHEGTTLSGAVLFVTPSVVHAQYLCSSPQGDAMHANEVMVDYILSHYPTHRYFDFGTSADEIQFGVNPTLLLAKESYGCRAIMYDTYEVEV